MTDFQKALDRLPDGTGFDWTVHHDISDLVWLCLHEIDLHHEGEYRHTKRALNAYRKFISEYGYDRDIAEVEKIFPAALARREFYGEAA